MYKLYINNLEWKIVEVEKDNEKLKTDDDTMCYGTCRYYENTIYLDKNLCEAHKKKVLAHELTHAYIFSQLLKYSENYTEEEVCELVGLYGKQIWNQVDEYFFKQELGNGVEHNNTSISSNSKKRDK